MKILHLLWTVFFLITFFTISAEGEILDATVAVINDEIITRSELNQATHKLLEKIRLQYNGPEQDKAIKAAEKEILNKWLFDRFAHYYVLRFCLCPTKGN